jgi:phosphoribosylamine---glycine ligase
VELAAATDESAVTVVLAGGSYPEHGDSGTRIEGVVAAEAEGALVFHAGTALRDGDLMTNGGRILNVTALGASIAEARELAYRAAGRISFPGVRYRRDIAEEAAHVAR